MHKPMILAGGLVLGGAAFLIPTVAAQQSPPLTAAIEIACTTTGDVANHSYTVTLTNHTDSDIDMTGDATLTVNGGTPGTIETGSDPVVDAGDTYTYPTVIPIDPDGDVAVTAVFNATYEGDGDIPITVTGNAAACEAGPTTTTAPTTTTTSPAVQAEVDFTG